jgi:hypothetical protein
MGLTSYYGVLGWREPREARRATFNALQRSQSNTISAYRPILAVQEIMAGVLRAPASIHSSLEGRKPTINVLANLIFRKTISLLKPAF